MRSLEDHLSPHELATLPDSPETLASGGPEQQELSQHLEQCEECRGLAQTSWELRNLGAVNNSTAGGSCPPMQTWLEFAAGLHEEQSSSLPAHAAGCRDCALALKEAMQLMQPDQLDATAGTEPIPGLASATPAWQHQFAARLATQTRPAARGPSLLQTLRRWPTWIALPAAVAALCALILLGFGFWRSVHPSDGRLLAEAYNKQRTLVLRIPGAEPVPMASITRSGDAAHGLAEPAELLELRLRAQQHLDQKPNSPYWHQVLGEIELLDGNGPAAQHDLEVAKAADGSLPNLLPDLAAAWFELGDSSGNPVDYARAAELYQLELRSLNEGRANRAAAALLHYNLALTWERDGQRMLALDELHTALFLEGSAAWRATIQAEIDRIAAHSSMERGGDNYEAVLSEATTNLLPQWADPEVRTRIDAVAALGLAHHDRWLADWAALPHTPQSIEGDRHLGAAQRAALSGAAELSLAEARTAFGLYRLARNRPGMARATYDETYAYQRLGHSADCIRMATALEGDPRLRPYPQLRLRAQLDHAICANYGGNFAASERALVPIFQQALAHGLPQVDLYARTMQAALLHNTGRTSAAWQSDDAGLALCDQSSCTPTRRYSFLFDIMGNAQDLGLPLTAETVMRSAVKIADNTDAVTRAYAYEKLGKIAGHAGDFSISEQAFSQAYDLARSGNRAALTAIYQADWATDQAETLLRQGKTRAALDLLNRTSATMLTSDYRLGRIGFLQQESSVDLRLGQFNEALAKAQAAVQEVEHVLPGLRTTAARQAWAREQAAVYAQLIKSYLAQRDASQALGAWEEFRAIPYGSDASRSAAAWPKKSVPSGSEILILARIDDAYVGWLAAGQPLQVIRYASLGDHARLLELATTFYRLCADRNSSVADIHALGASLFVTLLEPLVGGLPPQHLLLDLDSSLSILPVAALTLPDGRWLGDTGEVSVLPPWWSLAESAELDNQPITSSTSALIVNGFGRTRSETTEASTVAPLFHHPVVSDADALNTNSLLEDIGSAGVFHFSGHADGASKALASSVPDSAPLLAPALLDGVHFPHTQLAVLAACNTTSADPDQMEELPDLRNALLRAGARNVVASNWDVDDNSTSSLMLAFYRELLSGSSLAHSLQIAQKSVHSSQRWGHPYYWAGFELFKG